ncbi:sensor histidine kinase [Pedobacter duraquae]|uniref:histidine kinase n=1 Tax=Pedobacter duraquae TaxID=425511 RepID=A0A4R6IGD5_9SPHI|nr:MASE3 domain-containing protein [Pedobacter duraquae]TDO20737.1 phospho-acceptor domain-containing protein [Pedobacter duraquae]
MFSVTTLVLIFYFSLRQNYLLFHSIIELFSIIIAFAVFIITWNSRKMMDNNYLCFVGITYIFVGALDLLHTLTFTGMNILPGGVFYGNQFWIITRFLEASTLVIGFYFLRRGKQLNADLIFLSYFFITLLATFSILVWHIFPLCFVEGQGQTPFKIYSEYLIIAVLFIAGYLLYTFRERFSTSVYRKLFVSLIFTILSEFCFTLYASNYSVANEFGHYFKLIAFFLIYKANVETGFIEPTELIFKNLKDNEEKYRTLAKNLKLAEQELKGLNTTKDKLFSVIAHDLKNPFTSLISFSELIFKNAEKLSTEKISSIALRINNSAKQAYVLLDNLLGWSRLQTGLLKPDFVSLSPLTLLEEAIRNAEAFAQSKSISIQLMSLTDQRVYTDAQMTSTVFRNLISNAIKFSHAGSVIILKAERLKDEICFSVSDTGIGIKEEHQASILNTDQGISSSGTNEEKGTGLGLILCREFVELSGGKIWFKTELGIGTTFYFTQKTG